MGFLPASVQLAVEVGLGLAICQLSLTALCSSQWGGRARRQPAFVAHQIITLPLMLYVASIGSLGWFFPTAEDNARAATVEGRLYGVNPIGERISSVVLGAMGFWDIPCTCLPSIYSVAGMGHHVGLAVLSAIALLPYTQHYAPFFIGVIEISSIPLVVVDLFHPKHFADVANSSQRLSSLNEAMRIVFAVSFLLLRTIAFPIVIVGGAIPDFASQLRFSEAAVSSRTILAVIAIGFALFFTALQLHWSYLLLKQVFKGLQGGTSDSRRDMKDPDGDYRLYVQDEEARQSMAP